MTARTPTFKKIDIKRAVTAVQAAGLQVLGVEIDPTGKITITTAVSDIERTPPLDKWMTNRARST
jgi:hypothetical protein